MVVDVFYWWLLDGENRLDEELNLWCCQLASTACRSTRQKILENPFAACTAISSLFKSTARFSWSGSCGTMHVDAENDESGPAGESNHEYQTSEDCRLQYLNFLPHDGQTWPKNGANWIPENYVLVTDHYTFFFFLQEYFSRHHGKTTDYIALSLKLKHHGHRKAHFWQSTAKRIVLKWFQSWLHSWGGIKRDTKYKTGLSKVVPYYVPGQAPSSL